MGKLLLATEISNGAVSRANMNRVNEAIRAVLIELWFIQAASIVSHRPVCPFGCPWSSFHGSKCGSMDQSCPFRLVPA